MTVVGTGVRRVLLLLHTGRLEAIAAAAEVADALARAGVEVVAGAEEATVVTAAAGHGGCVAAVPEEALTLPERPALDGTDLVVVLGGDGTILRGAELVRGHRTPLLGVNLGHVGFLAESERDVLSETVARVLAGDYTVEERMTVDACVSAGDDVLHRTWALNEVSVEKGSRQRMIEVVLEVDGQPLTRFGCDGLVTATPTGSTAYAFSAGGPVVWPEVEAMLVVPLSAHALFARPLVVGPSSVVAVETVPGHGDPGVLWADGRRAFPLPERARVEVRRGRRPVRLARLSATTFTERLVQRFQLPVNGWRGPVPLPEEQP